MIYVFSFLYCSILFADVLLIPALIDAGEGKRYPVARFLFRHAGGYGVLGYKAFYGVSGIWLVSRFGDWQLMLALCLAQAAVTYRKIRLIRRLEDQRWARAKDRLEEDDRDRR